MLVPVEERLSHSPLRIILILFSIKPKGTFRHYYFVIKPRGEFLVRVLR